MVVVEHCFPGVVVVPPTVVVIVDAAGVVKDVCFTVLVVVPGLDVM